MERKNSITLSGITNFLAEGAFLRRRDQWILLEGPLQPTSEANNGEITVFFPDFYDIHSASVYRGSQAYTLTSQQIRQILAEYLGEHASVPSLPLAKAPWQEPSRRDFVCSLGRIQDRIRNREIQKAVPVVFARSAQTLTPVEKALLLLNLVEAPSTLHAFGFWRQGEGILGATPETLFELQGRTLKTMALAGTLPKSEATERADLLADEKEMQEHRLVIEDLQRELAVLGDVQVGPTQVVELPTLFHLKTDITVLCHETPSYQDLIAKLHPTPALGVAPRRAGYKWMAELPGQEGRRGYGAPMAFLNIGEGDQEALCLVAIRNLQWNQDQVQIGSGCGIVAASELEREWRELFQKRLSVKKILGLQQ